MQTQQPLCNNYVIIMVYGIMQYINESTQMIKKNPSKLYIIDGEVPDVKQHIKRSCFSTDNSLSLVLWPSEVLADTKLTSALCNYCCLAGHTSLDSWRPLRELLDGLKGGNFLFCLIALQKTFLLAENNN